ncbi:MAG: hypothetical protein AAGA43_13475 [Bacteroidota bacterium]
MNESKKITRQQYLAAKKIVEDYEKSQRIKTRDLAEKRILDDGIPYSTMAKFFSDYEILRLLDLHPISFMGNLREKEFVVYRPHFEKYFFETEENIDDDSEFKFNISGEDE